MSNKDQLRRCQTTSGESRICNFKDGACALRCRSPITAGLVAASGGPSGPAVTFAVQGNIGEVIVNPYKLAPLTAIIRNGGYELQDVEVRIVPKQNGQEIKYKVSKRQLKTMPAFPFLAFIQTISIRLK